jgi:hypothetical protein|tara:strand:+ start:467 stop:1360 length:894 start_codon:yes stop_codon:yes gene_type:complete
MAGFTAIAAGVGMATTVGTTGASFGQAAKQKRMQKQAQREADRAMADARKKLDVNYLEALAIQKEPYELQREATLQAAATAMEGVREGSARGAAAGAGRLALATQQGTSQQRADMSKELQQLQMATAQEEGRLRDIGVQLDLQEVQGAQQAVADAEAAKRQATAQGVQGLISLGSQAVQAVPLYGKSGSSRAFNQAMKANPNLQSQIAQIVPEVGNMDAGAFAVYMTENFTPDQIKSFNMPGQGMSTAGIQTNIIGGSTVGLPQPGLGAPQIQPVNYQFQNPFAVGIPMPDFANMKR